MKKEKNEFYTDVQVIGNSIYYRGLSGGSEVKHRIPWQPTLFLPAKGKQTEWKTVTGLPVAPVNLGDIRETRDFLRSHEGVAGFCVYGNTRLEYNFIAEKFPQEVIEWDIDLVQVANIDIEVISKNGFPDPVKAESPITSIAVHASKEKKYTVFGLKDYDVSKAIMETKNGPVKLNVEYRQYETEVELLLGFLEYWQKELNPNVITGWNVKTFDVPYIVNRITKLLGEAAAKRLSVWGILKEDNGYFMDRPYQGYLIIGTSILDYLELYWKFATKQSESWKLDYIGFVELGERKLSYEEFSGLPDLYEKDHQKFISYNLRDVWLVQEMDNKKKLLFLALMLAYDSHTNYEDVFAQVTMWDQLIHCHLLRKKIVIPPRVKHDKKYAYEGAYVKEPKPGLYRYIASFDLNSLYPHLIMQYNISPETIVEPEQYSVEMRKTLGSGVNVEKLLREEIDLEFLGKQKVTITPNGQFFRTDKRGFLVEMMDTMYKDRTKYKKMMLEDKKKAEAESDPVKKAELMKNAGRYDIMQNVKKVCLNSAYGALGNEYFRFFDTRQAEGITMAGQLSIRWIADKLNEYLNKVLRTNGRDYVIASDTDSVYLELERLVELVYTDGKQPDIQTIIKMMDRFCEEKIQPLIEKSYKHLAFYVNAYEQKMEMKRESLADKGIWTAPKRYIMRVYNKEGVQYAKPKTSITGLEVIKSNTPSSCRKGMLEAIDIIMDGKESDLHAYSTKFKRDFMGLPLDEIAFPSGVKHLSSYADKNTIYGLKTPIHAKACLLYNHKLKQMQLHNKYPLIPDGEKIKWVYLKKNNPIGDTVIGFVDIMPPEFGLENFYDRHTQFQKAFVDKLEIITSCIGWSVEKKARLDI
jgi:DNA polymerase elongation subunit (family B)